MTESVPFASKEVKIKNKEHFQSRYNICFFFINSYRNVFGDYASLVIVQCTNLKCFNKGIVF
jgi:hypothetical protein